MRERVDLKSPVREYRSPGSVRGAPGNRRPYLDKGGGSGGERFAFRAIGHGLFFDVEADFGPRSWRRVEDSHDALEHKVVTIGDHLRFLDLGKKKGKVRWESLEVAFDSLVECLCGNAIKVGQIKVEDDLLRIQEALRVL